MQRYPGTASSVCLRSFEKRVPHPGLAEMARRHVLCMFAVCHELRNQSLPGQPEVLAVRKVDQGECKQMRARGFESKDLDS